jgi:hypothetical protein
MIKFYCDKIDCGKEIPDIKEAVNLQYAEQKIFFTPDKKQGPQSVWQEQKKILCKECKELVLKVLEENQK